MQYVGSHKCMIEHSDLRHQLIDTTNLLIGNNRSIISLPVAYNEFSKVELTGHLLQCSPQLMTIAC